jgi:hypothetical protein
MLLRYYFRWQYRRKERRRNRNAYQLDSRRPHSWLGRGVFNTPTFGKYERSHRHGRRHRKWFLLLPLFALIAWFVYESLSAWDIFQP